MKQSSVPAGICRRLKKLAGFSLAVALTLGAVPSTERGVYASEVSDKTVLSLNSGDTYDGEEPAYDEDEREPEDAEDIEDSEDTQDQNSDADDDDDPEENGQEDEEPAPEGKPTPEPEDAEDDPEDITPTGEPEDDVTPTEEAEPTPKPTKKPKATPTPAEEGEPTPKPTKKPKATPTPAEEGEPTPKPTKKPKATPTPTEEGEESPTPAEDAEASPTPDEEEVTPTPTKKPKATPTPAPKYSVNIPSESNDARYQYLFGINAREITMKTPPPGFETQKKAAAQMTTIRVPVWKMKADGSKYSSTYNITVNKKLAPVVKVIFQEIYDLDIKFPIKQINGFMYRKVGGVGLSKSTLMSVHSFGAAIDINPGDYDNDYFLGKGNDLRDKSNPYCIPDEVIEIFEKHHWFWGGNFEICADTMHFQYLGLEMLNYQNNSPFRTLELKSGYMKGTDVRNLQQRLRELGYKVTVDGVYGSKTASAIQKYQKDRGLEANGVVDYKTWETIINETHYMSYVF